MLDHAALSLRSGYITALKRKFARLANFPNSSAQLVTSDFSGLPEKSSFQRGFGTSFKCDVVFNILPFLKEKINSRFIWQNTLRDFCFAKPVAPIPCPCSQCRLRSLFTAENTTGFKTPLHCIPLRPCFPALKFTS